ncbi:hypothetical protein GGR92_001184 [Spirosoma lacussanchae]|uniref:SDR family NAD(P)-dependent oxidoreductase n=1 Tax=Spirosoma lacussanchae TaxID=1884249 RepID=UPI001109BD02|nr:SDR family NAD(P)-dependent oxidoreductase [Spirosoma lacussanchae]
MKEGTGKTALITGASSGIGQELAKLFAQDGFDLVLVGRREETLDRLAEVFRNNYGTQQITVINKDLAREDVAQELYDELQSKGITVNILVNDAGASTYGKFATETEWAREKELIHLNVLTTTLLTKLFLRDMVARNEGRILQLASMVSVTPFPLMSVYAATKAYVWSLTQSLNNELKGTNVTMTALMPNATATNFFREAGAPKLVVEDMMDDPAMVAKDGYKALMKGEAKVVPGGLGNKAQELMSYVSPQEALASLMRKLLSPKHESGQDQKTPAWTVGIGIALAAVAGYALVRAYTNANPIDKARYRQQAQSLGDSASGTISSIIDSVVGTYHNGKAKVESTLA